MSFIKPIIIDQATQPSKCFNKAGVYMIINKVTNKRYVGSSKRIWERFRNHMNSLNINDHSNFFMQEDWNLYGRGSFSVLVIEFCSITELIHREQFWMDELKPEYNICMLSTSAKGVKRRESTREKSKGRHAMSEGQKRKLSLERKGKPSGKKGWKAPPETVEKMRLANLGKKYTDSINSKKGRKAELSNRWGIGKHVSQFDLSGVLINRFVSSDQGANSIARIHGGSNIRKCCDKKIPTAYGFKWEYSN